MNSRWKVEVTFRQVYFQLIVLVLSTRKLALVSRVTRAQGMEFRLRRIKLKCMVSEFCCDSLLGCGQPRVLRKTAESF